MGLLDGGDTTELLGDLGKALLLGGLGKLVIHRGPLVVLARGGVAQVVQSARNGTVVQVLKPQLGMLGLVARRLGKDIRNLNVAVLFGLGCIVAILGVCLGLTGKSGLEVLLGLRVLKIHRCTSLQHMPPMASSGLVFRMPSCREFKPYNPVLQI